MSTGWGLLAAIRIVPISWDPTTMWLFTYLPIYEVVCDLSFSIAPARKRI